LPVVLRPSTDSHYKFVGEVYFDTKLHEWWRTVWQDLRADERGSVFRPVSIR
jgi:hypothetical protein